MIKNMDEPVVITGLGIVSSIGIGKKDFSLNLRNGKDGFSLIEDFDISSYQTKKAAKVKGFNPKEFISPVKLRRLDKASQFTIAASKMAIEDGKVNLNKFDRKRIGIILGSGFGGLESSRLFHKDQVLKGPSNISPMLFPNTVPNAAASYTSIELKITGINTTFVQSFCSAEAAIYFAFLKLKQNKADMVLAGGVDELSPMLFHAYDRLGYLTKNKPSPFNKDGDGFLPGEGAGILLLERYSDAKKRGARIYGKITSLISKSYGNKGNDFLKEGIREIVKDDFPKFISASANGDKVSDKIEAEAIHDVFKDKDIYVVALKSLIGEGAAMGAQRIVAASLMLNETFIPPTLNFKKPIFEPFLNIITSPKEDYPIDSILHISFSRFSCAYLIMLNK